MKSVFKIFGLLLISLFCSKDVIGQKFQLNEAFKSQSTIRNANGVAVADYDQDGDLDIFITSADEYNEGNPTTWSRLLRNDRNLGFHDVTIESNLISDQEGARDGEMGAHMGASWGDYDNDGYPDLYLTNRGYNVLWHNDGNGQFSNVTDETNVAGCFGCYSSNAVWWDYDLDGDLDLYVSNWVGENYFYRNDGNNQFTDISIITGLNDRGLSFTSLPIDLNRDGRQDLYVVNDNGANNFYRNLGDTTFKEVTEEVGLVDKGDGMGLAVGDYNNDGAFDLYVTNIHFFHPNPFFINDGTGVFTNRSVQLGIEDTGWGWGARFFDADHDLDEDLYVVNGYNSDIAEGDRNVFFENQNGQFSDVAPSIGLNNIEYAMGLEVFDYDRDGDLEMLVANRDAFPGLYKNTIVEIGGSNSNWIQIELEGTTINRNAFGSTVRIRCDGFDYYRYYSGVNLLGQSIKPVHFGLSSHGQVDEIEITWPNGESEIFGSQDANQFLRIKQGVGIIDREVVTDIEEKPMHNGKVEFAVFPNPFDSQINLRLIKPYRGAVKFQIMNVLGQVVHYERQMVNQKPVLNIQLSADKSHLMPGIYFYTLTTATGTRSGSVVKR